MALTVGPSKVEANTRTDRWGNKSIHLVSESGKIVKVIEHPGYDTSGETHVLSCPRDIRTREEIIENLKKRYRKEHYVHANIMDVISELEEDGCVQVEVEADETMDFSPLWDLTFED